MQYMHALLVAKAKEVRDDGLIVERVIWELSQPLVASTHSYKYRLCYGAAGVCRIQYDYERDKGDHRLGEREEDFHFVSLERLLADFEHAGNEWSTS